MKKIILFIAILCVTFLNAQVVLEENFNESSIPNGWEISNSLNSIGQSQWGLFTGGFAPFFNPEGNTYLYGPSVGFSGNYPVIFSYTVTNNQLVSPGPIDAILTSPKLDCSGLTDVKLSLNHWFVTGQLNPLISTPAEGFIEVSNDNGNSWEQVAKFGDKNSTTSSYEFGPLVYDISNIAANSSNVKVRFRYSGEFSYYWAIDNVKVQQPTIVDQPDAVTSVRNGIGNNTPVSVYRQASSNSIRKLVEINYDAPTTGSEIESYDLVLSLNPDGSDPFLNIPNYSGTLESAGVLFGQQGDLTEGWLPNTTYYWYVNSKNIAGTTSSEIFSFTTEANTGNPEGLINYNPANNAVDIPISVDNNNNKRIRFSYENPNENFTVHQFLLGENANNLSGGSGVFAYGNDISLLNSWEENKTYYYKMITYSAWGVAEGETIMFTTGSEEPLSFTENPFETFTMAPNPASDFVTINNGNKIDLITIYNKVGQELKQVRKNELFNNTVDVSNLPKGLYLFKLDFRNQSKTYKLIKE